MEKQVFPVIGMMCASCSGRVERCLSHQEGVNSASVNLAGRTALVEYDETITDPQKLKQAVDALGYTLVVEDLQSAELIEQRNFRQLQFQTLGAFVIALLVMSISMGWIEVGSESVANQTMMLLSMVSLLWCGRRFFVSAWRQLKHCSAGMDTLVALSTGISFLFSVFNTFWGQHYWGAKQLPWHTYYDAAVMITFFVLLGRLLEQRAKNSTAASIRSLIQLQPDSARIVLPSGTYAMVPVSTIERGDVLEVRAGEQIAVDGVVKHGTVFVDQSAMTGESMVIEKSEGSELLSGTLVKSGTAQYTAVKVGEQTLLSKMIHSVQQAQDSKAPVQRQVDKVARVFVPTILVVSLLTFALWLFLPIQLPSDTVAGNVSTLSSRLSFALLCAVSVLVIACPCALGLATPTALMVGIGKAAKAGILIKDATALEHIRNLSALVIDKTGTLTCPKGGIDVTKARHLHPWEREQLKPYAHEAMTDLQQQGIEIHLMSGDEQDAVAYWAQQAGIENFHSGVLPNDKHEMVISLQREGHTVAMVGDGVNDSEALAAADVSIAMGQGTDIAVQVAQLTLVTDDLRRIESAHRLSKRTVEIIRQNLFWAFFYNVICIPLAAGVPVLWGSTVHITPMWASAMMACSSVSVVLNSLRLNFFKL